jgi:hypothetical protein
VEFRTIMMTAPRPCVAKPDCRQHPESSSFRTPVFDADPDKNIFYVRLGIFDENIEVTVLVEYAGVEQFVFELTFVAPSVFLQEFCVRKSGLRILVEVLHVGVRGRAVEVKVGFLNVFAVIPFFTRQSKKALLEDGIALIPERQR